MKKNFKPNTWLYPQPVLVIASYGADGTADGMVAAWGGIYDTNQVGFMLWLWYWLWLESSHVVMEIVERTVE